MKRLRSTWLVVGTALILAPLLTVAAFARLGTFLAAPATSPVAADVIVSLGGDPGQRAIESGRLFREHWANTVLVAGFTGTAAGTRDTKPDWRIKVLEEGGVPPAAFVFDRDSRSSWDEAVAARRLMEQHGWRRALVVSDAPHMRRLEWTWRHVFAGSSLEFVLVAAPNPWWHAQGWWRDEPSAGYVLREMMKLAYYVVVK